MKTLLPVLTLFAPCLCLADATLVMMEKSGASPAEMTYNVKDGKVRMEDRNTGSVALYDSASATLTTIDTGRKAYHVLDRETVDRAAGKMEEMMKQAQEMMKDMPEEQRRMMAQHMPGFAAMQDAPPEFRVERTGKKDTVAGISCAMVDIFKNGEKSGSACVAKAESLGLAQKDLEAIGSMFAQMRSMASRFGHTQWPDLEDLGGFPISGTQVETGTETRLESVSDEKLSDDLFSVPEGYRRMSMEF